MKNTVVLTGMMNNMVIMCMRRMCSFNHTNKYVLSSYQ